MKRVSLSLRTKMKTKKCNRCGDTKPLRFFTTRERTKAEKAASPELSPKTRIAIDNCIPCQALVEREELRTEIAERQKEKLNIKKKKARRKQDAQNANDRQKRAAQREITKAQAARDELIRRELAKKSLLGFTKRFQPGYLAGWMHVDICNRLERFMKQVERRENPRLMLFMPPRHGKTTLASQHFPGWALGHHPEWEIIAASYGSSLPVKFSRYVRSLLRDPKYNVLFPDTVLDKENENVEGWGTTKRGGYIPAGVGGGITGKGAHILIIDDPVKDAEEADSEVTREATWNWYGSTAYTRLAPENGVLVIQTRWHDDDLSGKLIAQMKEQYKELEGMEREVEEILNHQFEGDQIDEVKYTMMLADAQRSLREKKDEIDTWEIISYPAVAEYDEYQSPTGEPFFVDPDSQTPVVPDSIFVPKEKRIEEPDFEACRLLRKKGEALHPARYPVSQLRRRKNTMQPRHWHALYQQNPVPDDGDYFKKEHFRYRTGEPLIGGNPIGIAWDLAVGKRDINDYTVGAVGMLNSVGDLTVIDLIRGRWDTHESAKKILETYQKYRRATTGMVMVGIERGQLELAIKPELNRLQKKEGIFPNYDPDLKPLSDKLVRARPFQGRLEGGSLIFSEKAANAWVEIVEHEMLRFPNGTFDDCVDAIAWLCRMVEAKFTNPKSHSDVTRARQRRKGLKTTKELLRDAMRKQAGGNDPMAA